MRPRFSFQEGKDAVYHAYHRKGERWTKGEAAFIETLTGATGISADEFAKERKTAAVQNLEFQSVHDVAKIQGIPAYVVNGKWLIMTKSIQSIDGFVALIQKALQDVRGGADMMVSQSAAAGSYRDDCRLAGYAVALDSDGSGLCASSWWPTTCSRCGSIWPCEQCVYIRFGFLVMAIGGLLCAINPEESDPEGAGIRLCFCRRDLRSEVLGEACCYPSRHS